MSQKNPLGLQVQFGQLLAAEPEQVLFGQQQGRTVLEDHPPAVIAGQQGFQSCFVAAQRVTAVQRGAGKDHRAVGWQEEAIIHGAFPE